MSTYGAVFKHFSLVNTKQCIYTAVKHTHAHTWMMKEAFPFLHTISSKIFSTHCCLFPYLTSKGFEINFTSHQWVAASSWINILFLEITTSFLSCCQSKVKEFYETPRKFLRFMNSLAFSTSIQAKHSGNTLLPSPPYGVKVLSGLVHKLRVQHSPNTSRDCVLFP